MGLQSSVSGGQGSEEPHSTSVRSLPAPAQWCSYVYLQEGWDAPPPHSQRSSWSLGLE